MRSSKWEPTLDCPFGIYLVALLAFRPPGNVLGVSQYKIQSSMAQNLDCPYGDSIAEGLGPLLSFRRSCRFCSSCRPCRAARKGGLPDTGKLFL